MKQDLGVEPAEVEPADLGLAEVGPAVATGGSAVLPPAGLVLPSAGLGAAGLSVEGLVVQGLPGEVAAEGSQRALPAPKKSKGVGAIAAGLAFLLMKGKSALLLLKALPAGKLLLTSASMIAMVAFEARRSGVWFGVGFVLMILVHELGHGYAMKRRGVAAGWPIFIPFFGAMIAMKNTPRDRDAEAEIAYGGPLAGTLVSLAAAALGLVFDSRLFMALAYTGFFLNLFNLTPMSPLDGGRVAQAFSRRAWIVGVIVLGAMFLWTHSPQLLLIGALALPRLFSRRAPEDEREALEPAQQRVWATRYFGLAAFLGAALYFSGSLLGT